MHVFGRWEEAGEPAENPRIHGENMQTPHRQNQPGFEPGTFLLWGERASQSNVDVLTAIVIHLYYIIQ